jgi:hypothetical protein
MEIPLAVSRRQRAGLLLVVGASSLALAMPEAANAHPIKERPAVIQVTGQSAVRSCSELALLTAIKQQCLPKITDVLPAQQAARIEKRHEAWAKAHTPWELWAHIAETEDIIQHESSGELTMHEFNGDVEYDGLYSDSLTFWKANGGLKYAPNASQATRDEQNHVNYIGFKHRGYEPWAGDGAVPPLG